MERAADRLRALGPAPPLAAAAELVRGLDPRYATCMIWQGAPGDRLVLAADAGEHTEECPLPPHGGISRKVWHLNAPVALGNNKAAERSLECYLFAGSELAVPVPGPDGRACGTLHIQSEQLEAFTAVDRELLAELAAVIAPWLATA